MKELYTIGQVSAICNISVQGLRHYDKIGLLRPSVLNETTHYRYYSNKDIQSIRIIQDLKDMGFKLEEVMALLKKQDIDLIIEALQNKRQEVEDKVRICHDTLEKIGRRLENLSLHYQKKNNRSFEDTIEIKNLPDRVIASKRYYSDSSHNTIVKRFYELDNKMKEESLEASGFRLAIYHDYLSGFNPAWCDLEIGVLMGSDCDSSKVIKDGFLKVIPGALFATGIYKGEYQGQCEALVKWIKNRNYEIIGPGIEIYINSFLNTPFPPNYITEVQFPVLHKDYL